jgi:hypothetical protein
VELKIKREKKERRDGTDENEETEERTHSKEARALTKAECVP